MSYADFQLSYQTCPIVLVAGKAGTGVLPISSILNPGAGTSITADLNAIAQAIANGQDPATVRTNTTSTGAFGAFRVVPGGSLIDNETAKYPLATMATAANAIITNPLRISVEMVAPANANMNLSQRLYAFTALKSVLDEHIALGGYFNVATPAFIYTNCLLLNLIDESDVPDGAQTQVRWIWNFEQPLLTVQQAQLVTNNAMSRINAQTYNAGQPPGAKPLLTSVSTPIIGHQITTGSDNAAGATLASIPVAPSNPSGTGGYI